MLVTRKTHTLVKRYYTLAVKKAEKEGIVEKDELAWFIFNDMFEHISKNPKIPISDYMELCSVPDDYVKKGRMYIRGLEHFVESMTGGIIFNWKHKQEA